jgi:hypothetical protein
MKYAVSIEINAPIAEVIKRFDNPDLMKEWMQGLVSFEHVSGEPGQPGAVSKLVFQMGKRRIEMVETIKVRNLPEEFSGIYEAKGVYNEVGNFFTAKDEQTTFYETTQLFEFKGGMKIIGWLFPGAFKKQSLQYLKDFKAFVERDYKGIEN